MFADRADPIIQAPMAGGISTPALTAAVSQAGALGFVAGGLLTPDELQREVATVWGLTAAPFGVNLFCPSPAPGDPAVIEAYAARLRPLAAEAGVALGEPRFHDGEFDAKLALLAQATPAVVSFTFGCPSAGQIEQLRRAGSEVWVTVTEVREALTAAARGADAVIAQGSEAGGHRGSWIDDDRPPAPMLELVAAVRAALPELGLVAAGGIMTGAHVAGALAAGADGVQLGTAFMLTPEAGTSPAHRRALITERPTALTRAFSGRRGRGIVNGWMELVGDSAPSAYPELVGLTAPLRAAGLRGQDAERFNLWAGERYAEARALPAAELVAELATELGAVGGH